jgi:hypothetical protein
MNDRPLMKATIYISTALLFLLLHIANGRASPHAVTLVAFQPHSHSIHRTLKGSSKLSSKAKSKGKKKEKKYDDIWMSPKYKEDKKSKKIKSVKKSKKDKKSSKYSIITVAPEEFPSSAPTSLPSAAPTLTPVSIAPTQTTTVDKGLKSAKRSAKKKHKYVIVPPIENQNVLLIPKKKKKSKTSKKDKDKYMTEATGKFATVVPTFSSRPSQMPTQVPSFLPSTSSAPTRIANRSAIPTSIQPSSLITLVPSLNPTATSTSTSTGNNGTTPSTFQPTVTKTTVPTISGTVPTRPTQVPTTPITGSLEPSTSRTLIPTLAGNNTPTLQPIANNTNRPTIVGNFTLPPFLGASPRPSSRPTGVDTGNATVSPTSQTRTPSNGTQAPSASPSGNRTLQPSLAATSGNATAAPSSFPSSVIVTTPTVIPNQTATPTTPPGIIPNSGPPIATFAPTSFSGPTLNTIELDPYAVRYTLSSPISPSQENLFQAESLTITFINDVIDANFGFSNDIALKDISTIAVKNSANPAQIDYRTNITFTGNSVDVPTKAELNALVASMFEQPTVETLVLLLNNLPSDNPLSTTTEASFINQAFGSQRIVDPPKSRLYNTPPTERSVTGLGIAAIASTCVVGILLGGIVLLRRSDYGNSLGKYPNKRRKFADEEAPLEIGSASGSHSDGSTGSRYSRRSLKKAQSSRDEDMEIEFLPQTEAERSQSDDPLFRRPFCQAELLEDRSKDVLSPNKSF